MPLRLQIGTSSSSLIGREASEMSVSPAQNFSKPPPVPDVPTDAWTPEFSAPNCSAAAWANGPTVLEPSILIAPDTCSPPPAVALPSESSSPHAATPSASTPAEASASHFLMGFSLVVSQLAATLSWPRGQSVMDLSPGCENDVKARRPRGA